MVRDIQMGNNGIVIDYSTTISYAVTGNLQRDLQNLKSLIEKEYHNADKSQLLEKVTEAEQAAASPSKKAEVKEKMEWLLVKTSQVATIANFITNLLPHIINH